MTDSRERKIAGVLLFGALFALYAATMNRSIGFMDRGEMAAVASTWGIAHPTGYPTLTLLAGLIVHLVPARPVVVLNTFAAALVALGAVLLAVLFARLLDAIGGSLTARTRSAIATLAAAATALSATWWQQANGFEVYALHCVAIPAILLLAWRWLDAESAVDEKSARRRAFAFALVTGLSFTNHLTTVLLLPGLAIWSLSTLGWRRIAGRIPLLLSGGLVGLLPYAWIPLRSAMHPSLDWGAPRTWERLVHHIGGADYRGWMFSGIETLTHQTRYLAWRVPSDFAWIGLVLAALGALLLARRARGLAACLGISLLAGIVFAANYRIMEIDPYLLTIVFTLGTMAAAGLVRVAERFGSRAALASAAVLVALQIVVHVKECTERGNELPAALFHDLIGPLPQDAILFTSMWGPCASPALYFQQVERTRADVIVVNTDLMRVSWYLEDFARRQPRLTTRASAQYDRYLGLLRSAEAGRPYRGGEIESARRAWLTALAQEALQDHAVFSTGTLPDLPPGMMRAPWHLALRWTQEGSYAAEPEWRPAFRPWRGRVDADVAETCRYVAECRIARARYERDNGRIERVAALVNAAAACDPGIRPRDVMPLPLAGDRAVLTVASYFRGMHDALAAGPDIESR